MFEKAKSVGQVGYEKGGRITKQGAGHNVVKEGTKKRGRRASKILRRRTIKVSEARRIK